jgi:hypothetical protein
MSSFRLAAPLSAGVVVFTGGVTMAVIDRPSTCLSTLYARD